MGYGTCITGTAEFMLAGEKFDRTTLKNGLLSPFFFEIKILVIAKSGDAKQNGVITFG